MRQLLLLVSIIVWAVAPAIAQHRSTTGGGAAGQPGATTPGPPSPRPDQPAPRSRTAVSKRA
jgi:hypothetical protein